MLSFLLARLKLVLRAFKSGNLTELHDLSNKYLDESVLKSDKALAEIAVISYALHKLLTKRHITSTLIWEKAKQNITVALEQGVSALEQKNFNAFKRSLSRIVKSVEVVDKKLGHFTRDTLNKARVKYASRAYSFGLSLSQATELTSADLKAVQAYVGFTKAADYMPSKITLIDRLKKLKEVWQ
ncbi:MAG: hypothetical protein ABH821_04645 [archaeon]